MKTIWQAAFYIPWWLHFISIYLLIMGVQASKKRVVSILRLFILPLLFTVLSLSALLTALKLSSFCVSVWGVAGLSGGIVGWIATKRLKVRVDKRHWLIELPGTWSTLLIILFFASSKYYFTYKLALNPLLSEDIVFLILRLVSSGLCIGIFLGRLFYYLNRLWTGEQVDLKKISNRHYRNSN